MTRNSPSIPGGNLDAVTFPATATVHHLRRERMQEGDVYIGRRAIRFVGHSFDGYFGNPIQIGPSINREQAIRLFEAHARQRLSNDPEYRSRVAALHGKRLFCFCAPLPCHGDVLAKLAEELNTPVEPAHVAADFEAGYGPYDRDED